MKNHHRRKIRGVIPFRLDRYRCVDCLNLFYEDDLIYYQPATYKCLCTTCMERRKLHNLGYELNIAEKVIA